MPENRQNALKLLWGPVAPGANRPLVAFLRVKIVAGLVGVLALVLAGVVFLSALFLHLQSPAAVGMLVLAVGVASIAVQQGASIWLIWRLGRVTGWKQEPIGRHEQPVRYWTRVAIHAVLTAVPAAAAVFLTWSSLGLMAGR